MLLRLITLLSLVSVTSALADAAADCNQGQDGDLRIRACSELIRQNPQDFHAYWSRGAGYAKKGDSDRAIAEYTKAIEIKYDYSSAIIDRANEYRAKGEYDRAIADY